MIRPDSRFTKLADRMILMCEYEVWSQPRWAFSLDHIPKSAWRLVNISWQKIHNDFFYGQKRWIECQLRIYQRRSAPLNIVVWILVPLAHKD